MFHMNILILVDIFVFNTDLAVTCEVVVGCVLAYMHKMGGLLAHLVCWLYELYLQSCSHISSVMFIKYVYSAPLLKTMTSYVAHICIHIL